MSKKLQELSTSQAAYSEDAIYGALFSKASQDTQLSWEALGIFTYVLTKGDTDVATLIQQGTAGQDKVYKIVNELIERGYLQRTTNRADDGKFAKKSLSIPVDTLLDES